MSCYFAIVEHGGIMDPRMGPGNGSRHRSSEGLSRRWSKTTHDVSSFT